MIYANKKILLSVNYNNILQIFLKICRFLFTFLES